MATPAIQIEMNCEMAAPAYPSDAVSSPAYPSVAPMAAVPAGDVPIASQVAVPTATIETAVAAPMHACTDRWLHGQPAVDCGHVARIRHYQTAYICAGGL